MRVVIVDDNVEFLGTARRLLEQEGDTVVAVASSGTDALSRVAEHNPDVVLVDVDLGDENGFEVATRISAVAVQPPHVIMISAYAEQDLEDLIATSPAIGFVSKSRLSAEAVAELLDHARRDAGTRPS